MEPQERIFVGRTILFSWITKGRTKDLPSADRWRNELREANARIGVRPKERSAFRVESHQHAWLNRPGRLVR